MVNKEVVVYNGIRFRRYPDAKSFADRSYFRPGIADRKRGIRALHQEIWMAHYGSIPDGFHIHHVDGNPLNNAIENLECVDPKWHSQHHITTVSAAERKRREAAMQIVRQHADNWHRSDEGREWHRAKAKSEWADREPASRVCAQCGTSFESRGGRAKFCSNNCKSQARRLSAVDVEQRICVWCGQTFVVDKYSRQKCCSRSCSSTRTRALERASAEGGT